MLETQMQNLIYKRYLERISFVQLMEDLKELKDLYDEVDIRNFIVDISDKKISTRLIDEAKSYYAKKFGCNKEEVCYADFCDTECKVVPYACIVGNANVYEKQNCEKLKYVMYDLWAEGVRYFPNLEYVGNVGEFGEILANKKKILNIPKLRYCKYLNLNNVIVDEILLPVTEMLYINKCRVNKLNILSVLEKLTIQESRIREIPNLTYISILQMDNDSVIKLLNPDLKIDKIEDYNIWLNDLLQVIEQAKQNTIKQIDLKEKHGLN